MHLLLFAVALSTATCAALELAGRDTCKPDFVACNPSSAKFTTTPDIGPDMSSLYTDLLDSVAGIHFLKRQPQERETVEDVPGALRSASTKYDKRSSSVALCCKLRHGERPGVGQSGANTAPSSGAQGTSCLFLHSHLLPFCYDKFTTNYFLPDGAHGTLHNGTFTSSTGTHANLLTGESTSADGEPGNIYSAAPGARPDTATLSVPPQWTATGVGSAIPATGLGNVVVTTAYTTAIPGTSVSAGLVEQATTTVGTTMVEGTKGSGVGGKSGATGLRLAGGRAVAAVGGVVAAIWCSS